MGFIQLKELYYYNGGYASKPLLLNTDEIVNVEDYDHRAYVEGRNVIMKDGRRYFVKDRYEDIYKKIMESAK